MRRRHALAHENVGSDHIEPEKLVEETILMNLCLSGYLFFPTQDAAALFSVALERARFCSLFLWTRLLCPIGSRRRCLKHQENLAKLIVQSPILQEPRKQQRRQRTTMKGYLAFTNISENL